MAFNVQNAHRAEGTSPRGEGKAGRAPKERKPYLCVRPVTSVRSLPAEPPVWQGADYGEAKVFPLQVMNSKSLLLCCHLIWGKIVD